MKEPGILNESLPEGVAPELTVSELEEMACRQQQQIEAQRQLLAAKEQRLRFLKQHEAKHQQVTAEHERLRRLRNRVDAQEQKLRKLRALRGQVDQTKLNNASLTSDLESIRALFNEKEKELSVAVAKVEELTRQLEELQNGRSTSVLNQSAPSSAAIELEKLRAELLYRNKLNEQQSQRLCHQREVLAQKQEEMTAIDRRISELQERLHKKRSANQQMSTAASHFNRHQPTTAVALTSQQMQQLPPYPSHRQLQHHNHHPHLIQYQQSQNSQQHHVLQQILFQSPSYYSSNLVADKQSKSSQLHRPSIPLIKSSTGRPIVSSNIAAIEPYHHVPSSNNNDNFQQNNNNNNNNLHKMSDLQTSSYRKLESTASVRSSSSNNNNNNNNNTICAAGNEEIYPSVNQRRQPSIQPPPPSYPTVPAYSSVNKETKPKYLEVTPNVPQSSQTSTVISPSYQQDDSISEKRQLSNRFSASASSSCSSSSGKDEKLTSAIVTSSCSIVNNNFPSEFLPNKYDSKYQTLPYGVKFNSNYHQKQLTTISSRRPAEGIESDNNVAGREFNENTINNYNNDGSANNSTEYKQDRIHSVGGLAVASSSEESNRTASGELVSAHQVQQQLQPLNIVHSIPIQSTGNKCLATTPVYNIKTCSNSVIRSYESSLHCYSASTRPLPSTTLTNATYTVSSTANVTLTSIHQKPVSSVSPIYQTSSIRIQPVQPQILGSVTTNSTTHDGRKHSAARHSPIHVTLDHQKPALPPKSAPLIKATPPPPPRQSAFHAQHVSSSSDQHDKYSSATVDNQDRLYLNQVVNSHHHQFQSQHLASNTIVNGSNQQSIESRLSALNIGNASQNNNKRSHNLKSSESNDDVDCAARDTKTTNLLKDSSNQQQQFRKSDSPPPYPNIEPPSDDEIDKRITMRTIVVQTRNMSDVEIEKQQQNTHISTYNNNIYNNNNIKNNIGSNFNCKLMSDIDNRDSSSSVSSDGSNSADNPYFPATNRRIELPPAYLFPENETPPKDLLPKSDENNYAVDDCGDRRHIVLNMKPTAANVDDRNDDIDKCSSPSSPNSDETEKSNKENEFSDDIKSIKKGNLKHSNVNNGKRRVSFDPLALLLDASLEGELELVVRTAGQVKNPSAANDEGITALHNAICAGHVEIVRFLVQFGCDVNAQDSDGWTPLHCAASCNNLAMVRFLVEHGACIFATTLSDQETAAEKCEEDEEGFDGCSEFLYSVQEKLGILNTGIVYAVFNYEAHNPDELSFKEGDRLTVLRKGDEWEREWWWSRLHDKEGYVPRNLLGLYPRIHQNKIQD